MFPVTPKQMYSELAKIAGKECRDGPFVNAGTITPEELKRAQSAIMALMEKLNYRRAGEFRSLDHFGVLGGVAGVAGVARPDLVRTVLREGGPVPASDLSGRIAHFYQSNTTDPFSMGLSYEPLSPNDPTDDE